MNRLEQQFQEYIKCAHPGIDEIAKDIKRRDFMAGVVSLMQEIALSKQLPELLFEERIELLNDEITNFTINMINDIFK